MLKKGLTTSENISHIKTISGYAMRTLTSKGFVILFLAALGFTMTILSLRLSVNLTPSSDLGESIERITPPWYWMGIGIMVATISYTLTQSNAEKFRIPYLISCAMLIFSMRSVLAIISPFPAVGDTWGLIYSNEILRKYGIFSSQGLGFFSSGYARGWPTAFILAYLFTSVGIPVYTFYQWAPTVIFILDLTVIFYLFKELANEKTAMVSAFLFTLLNTNGFFPLHYCPQTVGALTYLVAMYAIVKAYKNRKLKHMALAFCSIFVVVLTHHISTLFLGMSLAGAYLSKYLLGLQQKLNTKNKWFASTVKSDTFIKFSLPLAVFTFALWYFHGFIVYGVDATMILTAIMRLLTTHEPRYYAGYYNVLFKLSPLSQLTVLIFPLFILGTASTHLLSRILKKESIEGYLWLTMGWAGALAFAFILGNLFYGNYVEPLRAEEIITVALYPASSLFLLKFFESKSQNKKGLITVVLIVVAFSSVFSIYRKAQSLIFFQPPWWMNALFPS